jgi:hypothetical protein
MAIDYVRRTRPATTAAPTSGPTSDPRGIRVGGAIGRDLAYWVRQYRALTAQIQAAEVTNHDRYRKERVNVRELHSRRAAATARMADLAEQLVGT